MLDSHPPEHWPCERGLLPWTPEPGIVKPALPQIARALELELELALVLVLVLE